MNSSGDKPQKRSSVRTVEWRISAETNGHLAGFPPNPLRTKAFMTIIFSRTLSQSSGGRPIHPGLHHLRKNILIRCEF